MSNQIPITKNPKFQDTRYKQIPIFKSQTKKLVWTLGFGA